MNLFKELAFYFCMLCVVIMLGSVWNVSKAQELTAVYSKNGLSEVDLEIIQMRNELLRDIETEQIEVKLKEHELEVIDVFDSMESRYLEEKREIEKAQAKEKELRIAIEKAEADRIAAEAKAKAEAEAKAKAKAEADAKSRAQLSRNSKSVVKAKQHVIQAEGQQQTLYVEASAYTSKCKGCSGITSYGYDIRNTIYYNGMRVIAADTSILPFGTVVNIQGIGQAVVLDRGGAIKGNKIDILVSTGSDASNYGRRYNVRVDIVGRVF